MQWFYVREQALYVKDVGSVLFHLFLKNIWFTQIETCYKLLKLVQSRGACLKNFYSFVGGSQGQWQVTAVRAVKGAALASVEKVAMINLPPSQIKETGTWVLQGFTSNIRYAQRSEINQLKAIQEGLNRPASMCAALIPIKKTDAWWLLSQDERRAIFEEQSHHTDIGLKYLPAIARQLHHCRDLGEPFDFVTWFEFSPDQSSAFDKLLEQLRATKEWEFVEREVEIRLQRI